MNITQQTGTWTGNLLKITMDHAQGCDWLLKCNQVKIHHFHIGSNLDLGFGRNREQRKVKLFSQ